MIRLCKYNPIYWGYFSGHLGILCKRSKNKPQTNPPKFFILTVLHLSRVIRIVLWQYQCQETSVIGQWWHQRRWVQHRPRTTPYTQSLTVQCHLIIPYGVCMDQIPEGSMWNSNYKYVLYLWVIFLPICALLPCLL